MRKLLRFLFGRSSPTDPLPVPSEKMVAAAPAVASAPEKEKLKKQKHQIFCDYVDLYKQRLETYWNTPFPAASPAEQEIGILITPWVGTPVPLFCLELAFLARSRGVPVRLILDDTEVAQNAEIEQHREALRQLTALAGKKLPVSDIREVGTESGDLDLALAKRIVTNLSIWRERGETNAARFLERNPQAVEKIAGHLAKVEKLLSGLTLRNLFLPGGIFGLSSIYRSVAEQRDLQYTTFDSGEKTLLVSRGAVAAHRKDLERVIDRLLSSATEDELSKLKSQGREELSLRMKGADQFAYQVVEQGMASNEAYEIFVPLNIRWDAAALDCERLFGSCMEWLEALLSWVGSHKSATICLREHPAGRRPGAGSKEDYTPLLQRFGYLGNRLRFASATEVVNTYDLMAGAKVVLPFTSSVGIEAAMLGKPVVLHSNCYYRNMGFCRDAQDRQTYFDAIADALEGRWVVRDDEKERAEVAYYLTQRCSFLAGDFNPHPAPYERWVKVPPGELARQSPAKELVDSLIYDEDLPWYVHQATMSSLHQAAEPQNPG